MSASVQHKRTQSSQSLLSAPPHVLPPIPTLCLPFLSSLLPRQQRELDEDPLVESEAEGQSSEDEGQQEVGVASSNVMEVDIECRDIEVKNYDWLIEHFRRTM